MHKKIMAVVLSCLTALTLVFTAFSAQMRVSAVSVDEMTTVAVQLITKSEGTYNSINPNDNGAVSVGILQWHATRALQLMRSVANADTATAKSILGSTFYNEVMSASSWETRTLGPKESSAAGSLLNTSAGHSIQDNLAFSDVQGYINAGKKYGLTDAGVLVYFATLYNRGSGVAARILSAAKGSGSYADITLDTLHNTAMTDRGNSSGYYTSRMNDAYNKIVSLGWAGQTSSGTTTKPAEPDTSDFSESYAGSYTVKATSLNVRSAPSTSASKVGSIPNGATVKVTSGNGSWAAVSYNGISGYCSMDYLVAAAAQTTAATTAVTTTTTTTTTKATTAKTTAATTKSTASTTTTAAETTQTEAETTILTEKDDYASIVGTPNAAYASVYGDVNCDGVVDASDAVLLQKYLNGSVYLNFSQLANADCQRDSVLNATDVTVILQYLIDNLIALPVL